jgi:hypothetical protein
MIKNHVISVKWAAAVNAFEIKKPEDLDILEEFRNWYTKADSISQVPQPYKDWVLFGLPQKHLRPESVIGTVTPKFSIEEIED